MSAKTKLTRFDSRWMNWSQDCISSEVQQGIQPSALIHHTFIIDIKMARTSTNKITAHPNELFSSLRHIQLIADFYPHVILTAVFKMMAHQAENLFHNVYWECYTSFPSLGSSSSGHYGSDSEPKLNDLHLRSSISSDCPFEGKLFILTRTWRLLSFPMTPPLRSSPSQTSSWFYVTNKHL